MVYVTRPNCVSNIMGPAQLLAMHVENFIRSRLCPASFHQNIDVAMMNAMLLVSMKEMVVKSVDSLNVKQSE